MASLSPRVLRVFVAVLVMWCLGCSAFDAIIQYVIDAPVTETITSVMEIDAGGHTHDDSDGHSRDMSGHIHCHSHGCRTVTFEQPLLDNTSLRPSVLPTSPVIRLVSVDMAPSTPPPIQVL